MRALTIRQPHASLVAVGAKTIETKSRPTSYRGPLLIHAGKHPPEAGSRVGHYGVGHHRLTYADHVDEGYTLAETIGRQSTMGGAREYDTWPLPLGAVVASCQLVDCVPITHNTEDGMVGTCTPGGFAVEVEPDGGAFYVEYLGDGATSNILGTVRDQLPFGDFSPGRYAWLLGDVRAIDPIPARGKQGLWIPDESLCATPSNGGSPRASKGEQL